MPTSTHEAAMYLHAEVSRVWQACTQPECLSVWFSAPCLEFGTAVGNPVEFGAPDRAVICGALQTFEAERQLAYSFAFQGFGFDETSTVSLRLLPAGPTTLLQVRHAFPDAPRSAEIIGSLGWPKLLARLKTWLETGTPMPWPDDPVAP